jgi:asparagine synthase (glutamine-hydrolysing)
MCGISGLILRRRESIDDPAAIIRQMTGALRHRGPDGEDWWTNDRVYLGHTRLAIIDLVGGRQPMASEQTGCVIVYNGEIYNYREVRSTLIARGHRFVSESDTEVILRAYEEFGPHCVERFNGMFAFALWDPRRSALFLARDRVGKKPLYYTNTPGFFAFASEPKALMRIPAVRVAAEPDPQALSDFLSLGYILTPKSAFRTIRRLPAASWTYIDLAATEPAITDYWPVREHYRTARAGNSADDLSRFGALLDDAVSLRLHADVPIGLYLSGGVDSAAVAAMAARTAGMAPTAFCVSFDEASYDESLAASVTAHHLGLGLVTLKAETPRAGNIASLLDVTDEPFADSSLSPSLALNRAARQRVTVALSGDGADELLAGYPTYLADRLYQAYRHVPAPLQQALEAGARHLLRPSYRKVSWDYKARRFLGARGLDRRRAHYWWRTIFSEGDKRSLMHPDLVKACGDYDPYDAFDARFDEVRDADFLSQCLYVDLKTWLQDDILFKIDRSSMAYGLEVRCPFLDHRMVEFAAALPSTAKFGWWRRKKILRAFLDDKLPQRITAGAKRGFNAPTRSLGVTAAPRAERRGWIKRNFRIDEKREDVTFKALVLAMLDEFAGRERVG